MHRLVCRRVLQLSKGNNVQLREYATPSSNQYPYPTHKSPTPHQIFHLPHSATENDIKARYFDLVKIYHPDKASGVVSLKVARERFEAITAAYDILRGKKKPYKGASGSSSGLEDRSYQTTAAYRAARRRRQELYSSGAIDDRWKDRIFLGLVVATVAVFVLQVYTSRREVLANIITSSRLGDSKSQIDDGINQQSSEDEERLSA